MEWQETGDPGGHDTTAICAADVAPVDLTPSFMSRQICEDLGAEVEKEGGESESPLTRVSHRKRPEETRGDQRRLEEAGRRLNMSPADCLTSQANFQSSSAVFGLQINSWVAVHPNVERRIPSVFNDRTKVPPTLAAALSPAACVTARWWCLLRVEPALCLVCSCSMAPLFFSAAVSNDVGCGRYLLSGGLWDTEADADERKLPSDRPLKGGTY